MEMQHIIESSARIVAEGAGSRLEAVMTNGRESYVLAAHAPADVRIDAAKIPLDPIVDKLKSKTPPGVHPKKIDVTLDENGKAKTAAMYFGSVRATADIPIEDIDMSEYSKRYSAMTEKWDKEKENAMVAIEFPEVFCRRKDEPGRDPFWVVLMPNPTKVSTPDGKKVDVTGRIMFLPDGAVRKTDKECTLKVLLDPYHPAKIYERRKAGVEGEQAKMKPLYVSPGELRNGRMVGQREWAAELEEHRRAWCEKMERLEHCEGMVRLDAPISRGKEPGWKLMGGNNEKGFWALKLPAHIEIGGKDMSYALLTVPATRASRHQEGWRSAWFEPGEKVRLRPYQNSKTGKSRRFVEAEVDKVAAALDAAYGREGGRANAAKIAPAQVKAPVSERSVPDSPTRR